MRMYAVMVLCLFKAGSTLIMLLSVFEAGCCNNVEIVDRVIGRCGIVVVVQSWSMYGSVCHTLIMSDGFGLTVQSLVVSIAFKSVWSDFDIILNAAFRTTS